MYIVYNLNGIIFLWRGYFRTHVSLISAVIKQCGYIKGMVIAL